MQISPDQIVLWELPLGPLGALPISATIVFTWAVMAILVIGARFMTRTLTTDEHIPLFQNLLEALVEFVRSQIRDVTQSDPGKYLPFIGTLFLFIAVANLLAIVPGFSPPTGSLSTTTALAICVLIAVPIFGIGERGLPGYLAQYLKPTPFMLPFNVIGEISRTVALAIRLYGNVMSGTVVVAILISVAPFFFPILVQLLGLLTGMVQAYIFAVLAMVYIASAARARDEDTAKSNAQESTGTHAAMED